MKVVSPDNARSQNGFTLIELLVVLVIASLGLTLMVPQFAGLIPGAELKAETRKIAAMLRHARSVAIVRGEAVSFARQDEEGVFWLSTEAEPYRLPTAINLSLSVDQPVDDENKILFFPDGSSTGGALQLRDGTRQGEVRIDWLTGRVSSHD